MDEISMADYIRDAFPNVEVVIGSAELETPEVAWGDRFFYCGAEHKHPMPFATIVTKDYPGHDEASNLNRPGVFRLNIGLRKETFRTLFPHAESEQDFAALDQLMPHPVYAPQFWVCILNPSDASMGKIRPLLEEAYRLAEEREAQR